MPKFQVVEGFHAEQLVVKDEKGNVICDADGAPRIQVRTYGPGSIVETDTPLDKKFNNQFVKFNRLDENGNVTQYNPSDPWQMKPNETPQEFAARVTALAQDQSGSNADSIKPLTPSTANIATVMSNADYRRTLEAMELKELRKIAEEEEIILPKNVNKDQAIQTIMGSTAAMALK